LFCVGDAFSEQPEASLPSCFFNLSCVLLKLRGLLAEPSLSLFAPLIRCSGGVAGCRRIRVDFLTYQIEYYESYTSAPIGKVTYIHQTATQGGAELNGPASLLFNADHSLYIHGGAPVRDSSVSKEGYVNYNIAGDTEGFPIYKRHRERIMTCKITCNGLFKKEKYCLVSDSMSISWRIEPDMRRFGAYTCQKAMGDFRGRTYEVWFAPDIPIPSGPFKLGGLPGLILEAQSTDGMVKFTFVKLETSESVSGEIKLPTGWDTEISHTQFIEKEAARNKAFLERLAAKGQQGTITRQETIEIW
jgi:GLPGLI family protein